MIIVYPMLVSRAVSENAIPGIAKTVENFIMINAQEFIINNANIKKQTRGIFGSLLSLAFGKLVMKEDVDLLEAQPSGVPPGAGGGSKGKGQADPRSREMYDEEQDILDKQWRDLAQKEKEIDDKIKEAEKRQEKAESAEERNKAANEKARLEREKHAYQKQRDALKDEADRIKQAKEDADKAEEKIKKAEEEAAKSARAEVRVSDMKSISLEPTYMTIDYTDKYGNRSSRFIGIKVVPIRVKSDVKLSHLLLYDTKVNALFAVSLAAGRKIMRRIWGFFDRWTERFRIGGLTPSGDPRRDILMGRTGMGDGSETFIVLSKQEDVDEFFLDNIQKINRLYRMGWGNFVIADDIGRTAWFCMERFRGMCNAVPYAMMYKYLGQDKAYETMEDAKKANSSIFKVSKKFSRVIGECKADLKLDKYSQLSEGNHDE